MFIYCITNDVNDKAYVGSYTGTDLRRRWSVHLSHARRGNGKCRALHSAMRKHGLGKFHIVSLWSGHLNSRTKLGELESYFVHCFGTKAPLGYNLTDGGDGVTGSHVNSGRATRGSGWHHTPEARRRISETQKGRVNVGRKPSEEALAKREATMGPIRKSAQYRRNLSEAITRWWAQRKAVL
jgi:group I intron endonuclease